MPLERAIAAAIVKVAVVGVALDDAVNIRTVDSTAKHEDIAGLGTHDEMMFVDGAFHTAGLVGAFEMALDGGAILLQVQIFGGS